MEVADDLDAMARLRLLTGFAKERCMLQIVPKLLSAHDVPRDHGIAILHRLRRGGLRALFDSIARLQAEEVNP